MISLGDKLRLLETSAKTSNPIINAPFTSLVAWQPTTAYARGVIVSNGGNAYICYTSGTSGGSGPSGTGANGIVDGTVTWFYYGVVTETRPLTPSFVTAGSVPADLTKGYTIATATQFSFSGGVPFVILPGWYSFPAVTASPGNAGPGNNNAVSVTFMTDAPRFAIGSAFYPIRIIVDGSYVDLSNLNPTGLVQLIDFTAVGGRKARKITIESGFAFRFQGVYVTPADTVWAINTDDKVKVAVVGDSYTSGGNSFPIAPRTDWPSQVGHYLGWSDVWNLGAGGTGYITQTANSPNFAGRIADVVVANPDVVIVAGGYNDSSSPASSVQNAVTAYCSQLRAALTPTTPIIVTGIASVKGPDANTIATEYAIQAGAAALNDPFIYFIPISTDSKGAWLTGTGNVTAPKGAGAGSGNADVYVSSDTVHPTQSGINYLAFRLAVAIRDIISQADL